MKRKALILLVLFLVFPLIAHASGGVSVSSTNLNINRGGSATFTIRADNAAGRVNISTSNGSIASVSKTSEWLENNSISVTVKGLSVGSTTIIVTTADMATFDNEVVSKTFSINVNVSEPKAGNNNLKNLGVEGYEIINNGDNTYSLVVANSKDNINIIAEVEDTKAMVSGTGVKSLNVGENRFEVVVTAENGSTKVYTIIVTRKNDTYYIEDIDDFINSDSSTIYLHNSDTITENMVEKISSINKEVSFVNNESEIKYAYIVNSSNISTSFNPNINFVPSDDISKLSNYAQGVSIKTNSIPDDTSLRIYLNDNLDIGDKVNIYKYEDNELVFVGTEDVVDGSVLIDVKENTEYFLTSSLISNAKLENPVVETSQSFNIFILLTIIELLIIIVLIVAMIIVIKKLKKEPNVITQEVIKKEIVHVPVNIPVEENSTDYLSNENSEVQLDEKSSISNEMPQITPTVMSENQVSEELIEQPQQATILPVQVEQSPQEVLVQESQDVDQTIQSEVQIVQPVTNIEEQTGNVVTQ